MPVAAIRIIDNDLIRQVEAEREKRNDSTITKTAQKLLSERLAQLEVRRDEEKKAAAPSAA